MPGIVGIVCRKPQAECRQIVVEMIASMRHEAFYETGFCDSPDGGVYAGWVAHEGSYAARHSARCRDGIQVVVSGECVADGAETDIIAHYQQFGDGFVTRLNGLFSGVLIDGRKNRAVLFNDRYGIERIYFHETDGAFYFASEAKALLRILPPLRAFDDRGVAQYLAFGCTQDWQTLFRGVRLLEGGTLWPVAPERRPAERYFVPSTWEAQAGLTADEFEGALDDTFTRILPRYVGDGANLGVSLTGGLDTRMIMACLPDVGIAPVCYTFSGEDDHLLDERLAASVARSRKLSHHVLRMGSDFLGGYANYVDRTVKVTDGAFGATGAHEIYFNRRARDLAPIRLTGNFGSEVLRSMSTFKPLGLSSGLLSADAAEAVEVLSRNPSQVAANPVTFSAFREIPWSLFGSLAAGRSQVTFRTPYLDNDLVELAFRAPARSRQSPDAALHLVRHRNEALARIPTDRGLLAHDRAVTRFARRLFSEVTFKLDYLHKEGLPDWLSPFDPLFGVASKTGLLGLHKYLPYRRWFRRELAPYVQDVLTDPSTSRLPYWDRKALDAIVADHLGGRRNHVKEINAVLTLEATDRLLVRGSHGSSAPDAITARIA